jgi:hypothetical protein
MVDEGPAAADTRPGDEVTVAQIVEELDVTEGAVRVWLRQERLSSARKDGRVWVMSRAEVLRMLKEDRGLGKSKRRRAAGDEGSSADRGATSVHDGDGHGNSPLEQGFL